MKKGSGTIKNMGIENTEEEEKTLENNSEKLDSNETTEKDGQTETKNIRKNQHGKLKAETLGLGAIGVGFLCTSMLFVQSVQPDVYTIGSYPYNPAYYSWFIVSILMYPLIVAGLYATFIVEGDKGQIRKGAIVGLGALTAVILIKAWVDIALAEGILNILYLSDISKSLHTTYGENSTTLQGASITLGAISVVLWLLSLYTGVKYAHQKTGDTCENKLTSPIAKISE